MAVWHRVVVLAHMKEFGLRLNARKVGFSSTENHLSGRGVGSDHDAGTYVSCSDRVNPHVRQESKRRPVTLSSSFKNCWVWCQLCPMWYHLACCIRDPYSGGSRPRGSPQGETNFAWSEAREAYAKWWIRMLSYNLESSNLPSPLGAKAHSTQVMAPSMAFLVLQYCRVVCAPHIRQVLDKDLRATPVSSVLLP